ncbi:hypothetical protein OIU91_09685 [Streptomyces sp. NBC_01456]|uniref:hypothetical protein n=1 Tax=unclassified Streptomyces TaxID=2593676 RepID=UPI002E32D132|nr:MULTISPECIES: hypothetical protein [unclassified Streptomyces]
MGNEAPTFDELGAASPDLTATWGAWCPEEQGQVVRDLAGEEEAIGAGQQHNNETGHSAQAVLVPSESFSTAVQNLQWPFCILYNGRRWWSVVLAAPSPEEAADVAAVFVGLLNRTAQENGFPAGFSVASGLCEAG